MFYRWFFPLLWLIFIAVWIAMVRGGKAVVTRESAYSRLSHYLPLAIGVYLLAAPYVPVTGLNDRFAPLALWRVRLGAALTVSGVAWPSGRGCCLPATGVRTSRSSATMN